MPTSPRRADTYTRPHFIPVTPTQHQDTVQSHPRRAGPPFGPFAQLSNTSDTYPRLVVAHVIVPACCLSCSRQIIGCRRLLRLSVRCTSTSCHIVSGSLSYPELSCPSQKAQSRQVAIVAICYTGIRGRPLCIGYSETIVFNAYFRTTTTTRLLRRSVGHVSKAGRSECGC